jgi:hypothetical protein
MRCLRCRGVGYVYKVGGGYLAVDIGGKKVDCPLCLGKGEHEKFDAMIKEQPTQGQDNAKGTGTQEASETEIKKPAKKTRKPRAKKAKE